MCRSVEVSNGQVNNTANNRVAAEGVCGGGGGGMEKECKHARTL